MARRISPQRRRLLLRAGIVVLVILVFVAVPGYLATRPAYFSRFSSLAEKYDPWSKSTHVKANCQDCHVPPKVIPQTAYGVRMLGEFYYSLVARSHTPEVFDKPTNEVCLSCHDDLRSVSPKGDLKIPHKAHVNVLKMQCVQCHNYLVHEESPAGTHTPTMAGCLECHDGDTAKNNCDTCHTKKATPTTHNASDWLVVHPQKVTAECADCHAWIQNWCADCHARQPESHTADWRKKHGEQVAEHRNCEACHADSFCVRCHGELPKLNYNPALKLVE